MVDMLQNIMVKEEVDSSSDFFKTENIFKKYQ